MANLTGICRAESNNKHERYKLYRQIEQHRRWTTTINGNRYIIGMYWDNEHDELNYSVCELNWRNAREVPGKQIRTMVINRKDFI